LGTDEQGREVLSWIDGDVLADPNWQPGDPGPWPAWAQSEEVLVETARLVRRFHDAARTFVPAAPQRWRTYAWPVLLEGEIVCHGDLGGHNTIYRHERPVAFIDWDSIRPNLPVLELASAAWKYVPLGDAAFFERSQFERTPDLPGRLARFVREYGDVRDRRTIAWALQESVRRSPDLMRGWPDLSPGDSAGFFELLARMLRWLDASVEELVSRLD